MASKTGAIIFITICLASQVYGTSVNCTETGAGRFADPDDTTCQNYTLCVYDSSDSQYLAYDYQCPTTSVFNPNTAKCTASGNYVCNVTTTNSTNTTSVCTEDGYVADPDSTNCTTYIECVEETNGTFIETTYSCPNSTYFDPNTTYCDSDYNCTSTSNSTSSDTTFTCSATGRFANSTDSTCKTYYLCTEASNGTYIEYDYTCPSTSVFNPNTKLCTTSYTCT